MVIIDKTKNECIIIDFGCPFDSRIEEREKDKMRGYNNLKRELKRIWNMPVKVIPVVVVGALGAIPKKLKQWLSDIEIETRILEMQKTNLFSINGGVKWGHVFSHKHSLSIILVLNISF